MTPKKRAHAKKKAPRKATPKKASAKKTPPEATTKSYPKTMRLKCTLTRKEIEEASQQVNADLDLIQEIEADKASMAAEIKSRLAAAEASRDLQKERSKTGYEFRDVKCEVVKDWKKTTVITRRLDTKAVVESRPMREDEKQREFAGMDGASDSAGTEG